MTDFCPKFSRDEWGCWMDEFTMLNCPDYIYYRDSILVFLDETSTIHKLLDAIDLIPDHLKRELFCKVAVSNRLELGERIHNSISNKRIHAWEPGTKIEGAHYLRVREDSGNLDLIITDHRDHNVFRLAYLQHGQLHLCKIRSDIANQFGLKLDLGGRINIGGRHEKFLPKI